MHHLAQSNIAVEIFRVFLKGDITFKFSINDSGTLNSENEIKA